MRTYRPGVKVMVIETGDVFDSIAECAEWVGGDPSNISKMLRGTSGYLTVHGYHIVKVDDCQMCRMKERVMIVETGEIFETIKDAAKAIDGSPSAICEILNRRNGRITHKSYHFKRV